MNIINLDSQELLNSEESLDTEKKERRPSILNCIRDNDIETIKSLIKEKGIYKKNDGLEWTYMHYAAFYNNIEVAKELLNAGADINAQSIHNETPLFIATINTNVEMVDFLINNNANLYLKNKYNFTTLEVAKTQYKFAQNDELKTKTAKIIDKLENQMTEIINKMEMAINIDREIGKSINAVNEVSR